jgi:hypothetical protein
MMKFIKRMFSRKVPIPAPPPPQLTEADVDAMIARTGSKLVFQRASELGWSTDNPPPIWVWPQICYEVQQMHGWKPQPQPERTVH